MILKIHIHFQELFTESKKLAVPIIKKLANFPNNVWKTHEMQQLGQKWGFISYLEPNKKGLPNFVIEITV